MVRRTLEKSRNIRGIHVIILAASDGNGKTLPGSALATICLPLGSILS